jgi:hypothetical protein
VQVEKAAELHRQCSLDAAYYATKMAGLQGKADKATTAGPPDLAAEERAARNRDKCEKDLILPPSLILHFLLASPSGITAAAAAA